FANGAGLRHGGGESGRRGGEDAVGGEVDRCGEADAVAAADLRGGVLDGSGSRRLGELGRVVDAQRPRRAEGRGVGNHIGDRAVLAGAVVQRVGHDRGPGVFLKLVGPWTVLGKKNESGPNTTWSTPTWAKQRNGSCGWLAA